MFSQLENFQDAPEGQLITINLASIQPHGGVKEFYWIFDILQRQRNPVFHAQISTAQPIIDKHHRQN
jgi:hypothetical protein